MDGRSVHGRVQAADVPDLKEPGWIHRDVRTVCGTCLVKIFLQKNSGWVSLSLRRLRCRPFAPCHPHPTPTPARSSETGGPNGLGGRSLVPGGWWLVGRWCLVAGPVAVGPRRARQSRGRARPAHPLTHEPRHRSQHNRRSECMPGCMLTRLTFGSVNDINGLAHGMGGGSLRLTQQSGPTALDCP